MVLDDYALRTTSVSRGTDALDMFAMLKMLDGVYVWNLSIILCTNLKNMFMSNDVSVVEHKLG